VWGTPVVELFKVAVSAQALVPSGSRRAKLGDFASRAKYAVFTEAGSPGPQTTTINHVDNSITATTTTATHG